MCSYLFHLGSTCDFGSAGSLLITGHGLGMCVGVAISGSIFWHLVTFGGTVLLGVDCCFLLLEKVNFISHPVLKWYHYDDENVSRNHTEHLANK